MTSFLIVDAQSVKNTASAEKKGYDAGKKVSGIKRHIAVDTQGLPHAIAIAITTAEVTDRKDEARAIFETMLAARNHLGLLSEDTHPVTGEMWGNFPQTYSMVGIINAAVRLSMPWDSQV